MAMKQAKRLLQVLMAGALLACGADAPIVDRASVGVNVPDSEESGEAREVDEEEAALPAYDYATAWAMVDERTQQTGMPHTLMETAQGPLVVPYAEFEGLAVVGGDVVLGTVDEVRAWRDAGPVRGVAFKNVWFSDGEVRWFSDLPSKNGLGSSGIASANDAGLFLSTRTPVDMRRVSDKSDSNLEMKLKGLIDVAGGTTWMYWISWTTPLISYADNPSLGGVLHEMGHALGWAHEFQRADRDAFVDMSDCATADQFNYGKVTAAWKGTNTAWTLSPYDYDSVMNGYSCVDETGSHPVRNDRYRDSFTNPESLHDINSLYRMYGNALGSSLTTQRFGHAVASGDFDDDGLPDFVSAGTVDQSATGEKLIVLYFYRGVELDPNDSDVQYKWMPWFWYQLATAPDDVSQLELVTGDYNGDGIDDLAAGMPWADADQGRVKLLFMNLLPDTSADDDKRWAPWGRRGVRKAIELTPADFGLSTQRELRLGAALASGKLSKGANVRGDGNYDDLVIGAPGYYAQLSPRLLPTHGAVVHLRGVDDENPQQSDFATYQVIKNAAGPDIGFGKSIATINDYCEDWTIYELHKAGLVIGAPQGSQTFVYGCASSASGALQQPTRLQTLAGDANSKFGFAVDATSLRRFVDGAWRSKFYVTVGAPNHTGSAKAGRVSLFDLTPTGVVNSTRHFVPSAAADGDELGYSVKVRQRSDASSIDPIDDLMIAMSAPGAKVAGVASGRVLLWQPFNADGSNHSSAIVREPATAASGARYGDAMTAVGHRRNFEHAGFIVGSPASRESFVTMTTTAGSVDLLLDANTTSNAWDTHRLHLNVNSSGDRHPNQ